MRTTLDIADDVLQAAKERARREGKTAGEVISDLARRALTAPSGTVDSDGSRSRSRISTVHRAQDHRQQRAHRQTAGRRRVLMRSLFDVNVLIALLDTGHSSHVPATRWLASQIRTGWASCPITQNGCVRIMSHPGYPNALPVQAVMARLGEAVATRHHEFWPDDLSLLDPTISDPTRIHGPGQLTDLYLLALAVRHDGRFVTFDAAVPLTAVRGAKTRHLLVL